MILTRLCRGEWSSSQPSPRQACLHHAGQIHKLLPRHSSDRRNDLHCQSMCPGNSENHVLLASSLACRSLGATYLPCVWPIQLQPDALAGWEYQGASTAVDVGGWLNAGVQCEFGSWKNWVGRVWEKMSQYIATYIMKQYWEGLCSQYCTFGYS